MIKKSLAFVIISFVTIICAADVSFSNLDLSLNNDLLFKIETDSPGFGKYSTLFSIALATEDIMQLTLFPEHSVLLNNGQQLQIQNRFGVFRIDLTQDKISAIDLFPSFVNSNQIEIGKINPMQSSPNGKYLVYLKSTSAAYGDLMLYDVTNSNEILVTENIELTLGDPPTSWSQDSKYFVYSKNEKIYYYSIEQLTEKRVIAENYRQIGKGKITNTRWAKDGSLYYIEDYLLYKMISNELFTRAIYSSVLKMGKVVGKIPFSFDANFDKFWISPDQKKILLNKGQQNIFLFFLYSQNSQLTEVTRSLPYLYLSQDTMVKTVAWSADDIITILTNTIKKDANSYTIFRQSNIVEQGDIDSFEATGDTNTIDIMLSPNEKNIALLKSDKIEIKDYKTWQKKLEINHPHPLNVIWSSNTDLIITGAYYTEHYDLYSDTAKILALSQPDAFGFSKDLKKILLKQNGKVYSTEFGTLNWQEVQTYDVKNADNSTSSYRVYLEDLPDGNFNNMIMIRDLTNYKTKALFPTQVTVYEEFPAAEETIDFDNFNHGSRIRRREVALVFNVIDSNEGLTGILKVLKEYGLRCTFFVNGEFIRCYPEVTSDLAQSGHEIGSLFYAYFNMTDAKYYIDEEYIKRGLARNEDEYYETTTRELALLWHTPFYFINSEIIKASKEMNYSYVGRDVDTLDWVSKNESNIKSRIYFLSAQLVERIIEKKKPGSIIPIRVGIPQGMREDYLFQRLDILINGLIKRGYDIVTVSTLMEHAK